MDKKAYEFISKTQNDPILERRSCPRTGGQFPIFQSDMEMLDKLSPVIGGKKIAIPLPTLSPEARQIRRLLFRNERNFYNGISSLSNKKIFSIYAPESDIKVYEREEWWSDNRDPMEFGQEISFDLPVQQQINTLRKNIPALNVVNVDNENCSYTTGVAYSKNCYLINSSENDEDCYYGKLFQTCKKCMDCSYVYDSEKLYQCINTKKCFNCMYLENSQECSSCYFSEDLISCNDCMFCTGLRNARYCFENQQLSKEEYESKKPEFFWSFTAIQNALNKFKQAQEKRTAKYASITHSESSYGDFLSDDKNCLFCYDVDSAEECRYLNVGVGPGVKTVMDCNNLYLQVERNYENLGTMHTQNILFSSYIFDSHDIICSQDCYNSHDLFGCIGLKNNEYCIFNKQYTKEEYETLVPQIIEKMKVNWERGEFFSPQLAPFPYNDSLALEYFPIQRLISADGAEKILDPQGKGTVTLLHSDKAVVDAQLDLWGAQIIPIKRRIKETEINIPENSQRIPAGELPKGITEVDDSIVDKIILCESSGRPFRITKPELAFYRMMGLPLPHKHPSIRYVERLQKKAQRDLHVRTCDACGKEILSVYHQDVSWKVDCEECYNKEIYW